MEEKKQFDLFAMLFPMMRQIERFCENYCRSHGVICHSQARVLAYLAVESIHKDIFQKDVEFAFQIRPSSATALLQSLEHRGIIRRGQTANDARFKKIVLTTAILMVKFSKQERESGVSIYDAAMSGMKVRFRSVMMTALSFVIGVFPLVIASGAGAGSRQAVGITTFWGMLAATAIGMMFIPGLYVLFQKAAETVLNRNKKTEE